MRELFYKQYVSFFALENSMNNLIDDSAVIAMKDWINENGMDMNHLRNHWVEVTYRLVDAPRGRDVVES